MNTLFRLIIISLLLGYITQSAQAQPCTINTGQLGNIQPPALSTICADEPVILPNITFTAGPGQSNPGVVWGLYIAQPTTNVPGNDDNFIYNGYAIAVDENGTPIIGGGTADLTQSNLFEGGSSITVCFVPFISPDVTIPPDLPLSCSGVNLTVTYPCFTVNQPGPLCSCDADVSSIALANGGQYCANGNLNSGTITITGTPNSADYATLLVVTDGANAVQSYNLDENAPYNFADLDAGTYNICALNYRLDAEAEVVASLDAGNLPANTLCFATSCSQITILAANDPACFVCEAAVTSIALANGGQYCANGNLNSGAITITGTPSNADYATLSVLTDGTNAVQSYNLNENALYNFAGLDAGIYNICALNYYSDDETEILAALEDGIIPPNALCYATSCSQITILAANDPACAATCDATITGVSTTVGTNYCIEGIISGLSPTSGVITATGTNNSADYASIYVLQNSFGQTLATVSGSGASFNFADLGVGIGNYQICGVNYLATDEAAVLAGIADGNLTPDGTCATSFCTNINIQTCFACNASIESVVLNPNITEFCTNGNLTPIVIFGGENTSEEYENIIAITNEAGNDVLQYESFVDGNTYDLSGLALGTYQICGINYYFGDEEAVINSLEFDQLPSIASDICSRFACKTITITTCNNCNNTIDVISVEGGVTTLCGITQTGNIIVTGTPATDDNTTQLIITDPSGNIIAFAPIGSVDFANYDLSFGCYNVLAVNYALIDANAVLNCTTLECIQSQIDAGDICAIVSPNVIPFCMLPPYWGECCQAEVGDVTVAGGQTTLCSGLTTGAITVTSAASGEYGSALIITAPDGTKTVAAVGSALSLGSVGDYTVCGISYVQTDSSAVINSIIEGVVIEDVCYVLSSNCLIFTVLAPYTGQCCQAQVGDVTVAGGQTTLCSGLTTGAITVTSAASGEYGSALIITAPNGTKTVAAVGSALSLSSAGDYTVCGISYVQADSTTIINSIIEGFVIEDICYVLSSNCLTFTVLAPNDPACLDALQVSNIVETVAPDGFSYTVSFDISGGTGVYVVDGVQIVGSSYTSVAIPCGSTYSFNVTDTGSTGIIIVDGAAPCERPCPSAGTFAGIDGNLLVCSGSATSLTLSGQNIFAGTNLVYVLCTDENNALNTIVATNATEPTFSINSNPNLQANTTYYIVAVAGYTNPDGTIIFADVCTNLSNAVGVVFLTPVTLTVDGGCDYTTGIYTQIVYPEGGYPAYNSSSPYTLSGEINEDVFAGNSATRIIAAGDTPATYGIIVTDVVGCSGAESGDIEECTKTPVAVEWLSFRGTVKPEGNLLEWATATESNSNYFAVERSTDGNNFTRLGTVDAAGNSSTQRNYSFTDKQALGGLAYYRIIQFDFNGDNNPSKTITLTRNSNALDFTKIYPVPAHDDVTITFEADNYTSAQLMVYDVAGRLVEQQTIITRKGLNNQTIDLSNYTNGVYFVSVVTTDAKITTRFVKN